MTLLPARRPLRTEDVPVGRASAADMPVMPVEMLDAPFGCEGADPDLFFPTTRDDLDEALAMCRSCPVTRQCHDFGVATASIGVWGGVLLQDGRPAGELFPVERGPRLKAT